MRKVYIPNKPKKSEPIDWYKTQYLQSKSDPDIIVVMIQEDSRDTQLFTGFCLPCDLYPNGKYSITWVKDLFKVLEEDIPYIIYPIKINVMGTSIAERDIMVDITVLRQMCKTIKNLYTDSSLVPTYKGNYCIGLCQAIQTYSDTFGVSTGIALMGLCQMYFREINPLGAKTKIQGNGFWWTCNLSEGTNIRFQFLTSVLEIIDKLEMVTIPILRRERL